MHTKEHTLLSMEYVHILTATKKNKIDFLCLKYLERFCSISCHKHYQRWEKHRPCDITTTQEQEVKRN